MKLDRSTFAEGAGTEEDETARLRTQLWLARQDLAAVRQDLVRARQETEEAWKHGVRLEKSYRALLSSTTWQAMEPVRAAIRGLRGGRKPQPLEPHFTARGPADPRPVVSRRQRSVETMDNVLVLRDLLWGGQPEFARRGLEDLAQTSPDPNTRARATMNLAIWYEFQNLPEDALSLLDGMEDLPEEYASAPRRQMLRAFLYLSQGRRDRARDLLDSIPPEKRGANVKLALANVADHDQDRLDLINEVLAKRELAPLRLRDPALPLALDNIEGAAPVGELPDMGMVSVIMPAYAAADTIETAIRSVCQQTYRNLEIIVVDDCSPDDTYDVICRLAEQDNRIVPVRQAENGGAYPARNRGLSVARGDFITTHDADDWSHPQKIERQLARLRRDPLAIGVWGHWARVRPDLTFTTDWRLSESVLHRNHSSFLFRREASDLLGGWDNVRVSADSEFIWRVEAAYGSNAVKRTLSDVPLTFGRDDEMSLTRIKASHVSTIYYGLRQYYREISRYWHEQAPDGLNADQLALKMAMIPREMIHRDCPPPEIDLHLIGDCVDAGCIARMARLAEGRARVGITHRPRPVPGMKRDPFGHQFHEDFFELLKRDGIVIVLPGTEPRATETVALDADAGNGS